MTDEHAFIKLVDGWGETQFGPNMSWIDTQSRYALDKIARAAGVSRTYIPGNLQAKIAEIQGQLPKDKVAFYNRALGSFEAYGLNKNGDGWWKDDLVAKHATFVDHGRYFRGHANKAGIDPDFGRPIASAWNDRTQMVDLIILADLDKQAQEDIERLERGESIPTSMGCRVKFDVCTICRHQARHRGEYCEHVKEGAAMPYGMCAVLGDGRVCGVMNPDPLFFDLSRVTNPAFRGSENLLKVASTSSMTVVSSAKRAEDAGLVVVSDSSKTAKTRGQKLADMIKELPGRIDGALTPNAEKLDDLTPVVQAVCGRARRIPAAELKALQKAAGTDRVLATATALGLVLSPDEFSALAGDKPVRAPTPEDILGCAPTKTATALVAGACDDACARALSAYARERSFLQPVLLSAMVDAVTKQAAEVDLGSENPNSNPAASDAYVAYRSAVLSRLRDVDDSGLLAATKMAGTSDRYVTPTSSAFTLLAFCRGGPENHQTVRAQLLAKMSAVTDTLRVSGSMADDFGEDVMELMADNFLRSTRS